MAEVTGSIVLRVPAPEGSEQPEQLFIIDAAQLREKLWDNSPKALTDPNSEQRKKHQNIFMMLKPVLRGGLDQILKSIFGKDAPKVPREADVFQYAAKLLVNIVVGGMQAHEWVLRSEYAEVSDQPVYRVVELIACPKDAQAEATDNGADAAREIAG